MKNLIFFLVLFIPFSIIAQSKVESGNATGNDQTDEWMSKISSDSEMRGTMMNMMIEKTSGNEEEMMKLVNSMLSNPEMHKMIFASNSGRVENEIISFEPRGIMSDSTKVGKVHTTQPVSKK
jgi:hypothetical protein